MAKPKKRRRPTSRPSGSGPRGGGPPGQVGRRPSAPGFLFAVGVMWIVCGVIAFVALKASWKLIPGVVFVGMGLFWIRGAVTAAARREAHGPS